MSDDDFTTPTEGSTAWVAELRRRCPTPEETDVLCDRAERLAAIERKIRESLEEQARRFEDLAESEKTPEAIEAMRWCAKQLRIELRAILDPPEDHIDRPSRISVL